eukprot:TRINITY_DN2842_c0_g1_i3.p1 TRINITY_DN2842_c0_g1~~TRINITY_DN2842_c0_g1_i3.p1  ORF type:complete len:411 (+),score=100.32 TRINITY_DN2842_c0_g1_i3:115-1347(+)
MGCAGSKSERKWDLPESIDVTQEISRENNKLTEAKESKPSTKAEPNQRSDSTLRTMRERSGSTGSIDWNIPDQDDTIELSMEPSEASPLIELQQILTVDWDLIDVLVPLVPTTEVDKFVQGMVLLLTPNGKILQFLERIINIEVKEANSAGSLFRSNSMVSKTMKLYSTLVGKDLLRKTIADHVELILKDTHSFEVDPQALSPDEDLLKNREHLRNTCSKILRSIFDSQEDSPPEIHQICKLLQTKVAAKFPGSAQSCIGGFLFLRFFCPAIFTPVAFGMAEGTISPKAQRGLTLVTRTLQNVANNLTFGNKDLSMGFLDDFIQDNFSACQDYFDEMARIPSKPKKPVVPEIAREDLRKSMDNVLKICRTLRPILERDHSPASFMPKLSHVYFVVDSLDEKNAIAARTRG